MQAVIYTRVSLDRNSGRSTDDQETECRAECDRRGWPVRAVFCDNGISASRYGKERPEWERCKQALRADDVLVLWEASRSTRDLEEWVRLRNMCAELGVLVCYSGRILDFSKGDDRFTGGLDALMSERESEIFRERVLRGKRVGATEGRAAGRIKWGYRTTNVPGQWELDPVEAPKVREAVNRVLRGDSAYSIMQWLETQPGRQLSSYTVLLRALVSPTYAGLRVHKEEIVGQGTWPAIITEAEHRRLKARQRRRTTPPASPEPRHLLSGLAKCGTCKAGVAWRKNRSGTPIYACKQGHVSRLADELDQRVEELLREILLRVDEHQHDDDDHSIAIQDEIDAIDEKWAEWVDLAQRGEITATAFAMFEKPLLKRRAELEAEASNVALTSGDINLKEIIANWAAKDMRDKRLAVRMLLQVTIYALARGQRARGEGIEFVPLIPGGRSSRDS